MKKFGNMPGKTQVGKSMQMFMKDPDLNDKEKFQLRCFVYGELERLNLIEPELAIRKAIIFASSEYSRIKFDIYYGDELLKRQFDNLAFSSVESKELGNINKIFRNCYELYSKRRKAGNSPECSRATALFYISYYYSLKR